MLRAIQLIALVIIVAGCSSDEGLEPFTSDACSLFPDRSILSDADWCSCCFEHDLAYWRGGTTEERVAADRQLSQCVRETNDAPLRASLMYAGARAGGSPHIYTWFRWGYGWPYGRGYQELTPEEDALVETFLPEDLRSSEQLTCPVN